jgi:phosphate-selective porin
MRIRITAALAALALVPAGALAEEGEVDTAALQGKVESLTEQFLETKGTVDKLSKLKFSGYVQGRYGWLEATDYTNAKNTARQGFFIRRGRLKASYDSGVGKFVMQLDATQSGVSLKEAYGEFDVPMVKNLTVGVGQVLLPFGYDVGVRSSSDLDLLERMQAARSFLNGEYDRGIVVSYAKGPIAFRGGVFNGNGVDGGQYDNDNLKDVVGRLSFDLGMITGGVSGWFGKERVYQDVLSGTTVVIAAGDYDRTRLGVDLQAYLDLLPVGGTAIKGELITGKTAINASLTSQNIGETGTGWAVLLTQNVGMNDVVAVRYDTFDPRTGLDDGAGGRSTAVWSFGLHHYLNDAVKLSAVYDLPQYVKVPTAGASKDPKASAFTVQLQAKF